MRKKHNQKLYKTMMLSALAFMILCSFKASANPIRTRCTVVRNSVQVQRNACLNSSKLEPILSLVKTSDNNAKSFPKAELNRILSK